MANVPGVSLIRTGAKKVQKVLMPDTPPATPAGQRPVVIDCAVYRNGRRVPGEWTWEDASRAVRADGGFVWLGLHEPSAWLLGRIARQYGLHELAVEDAVHAHQRPKVEQYDEMLFAVVKTVHYDRTREERVAEVVETGEIMLFVGADFVITVRHGAHGGLGAVRQKLEDDPTELAQGPSAVLHEVLDRIVDGYLTVANSLQEDIDQIENNVFAGIRHAADTNKMYRLKRAVMTLRRTAEPLIQPLDQLCSDSTPFVSDHVRKYLRNVADHLKHVAERVAEYDDLLTTLVSANLARVGVQQNEDMRKISAWVAIVAVPTMIAGIYGMNFEHMPELEWTFGYPLVLIVMVGACFLLHRSFKRNGWL